MKRYKQDSDFKMDEKLLQCLEGTATSADYKQVYKWAQEPQNREHYRELLDAAVASHLIQPVDSEEQNRIWKKIKEEISVQEEKSSLYHIIWKWTAAAAVIALIILSGIYTTGKYKASDGLPYTVETVKNGKSVISLNDGSKIWLNRDSKIVCDKDFGIKNRRVVLTGEAYFEVAKVADKPFIVGTDDLDVEALGTQFNISSSPDDMTIAVTLTEGKVKVTAEGQQLTLQPGQQLQLDRKNNKLSVFDVDCELFTSWRNDEIIFKQETLEEIFGKMRRNFHINIRIENTQIADRKITGRFPLDEQPEKMLKILQKQTPFNYYFNNDTIIIH